MDKKQITKIVVTGGPCAGKTTGMKWIKKAFTDMGYEVIFIPETATELISNGVAPWTLNTKFEYQLCQMKLQIYKEKVFEEAAGKLINSDKVLIICDRGMFDNKAYMPEDEFKKALAELNLTESELTDKYDAVFHLETAAKSKDRIYTLSNNQARTETADEAIALDDKLIAAWTGHPHFRVIDSARKFEEKMGQLVAEISTFLGEGDSLETERKFLIDYPDISVLGNFADCRKTELIQTYLNSENGEEKRVRQKCENGRYSYFKTTKRKVNGIKRIEIEKSVSQDEYIALLRDADRTKNQIHKTRYTFAYKNRCFEIDVYPFWTDKAILEIELADENEKIEFPEFIKIIKEVTGDDAYKNSTLAMK